MLLECSVRDVRSLDFVGFGTGARSSRISLRAVCAQVKEPPAEGLSVSVEKDRSPT